MELVYSMRRKPLKCEPPHFERASSSFFEQPVRPICTVSCGNIIAFSSPTELSDADCNTWGGHVYVCDMDTPWDSHKVVSTTHPVSALEWDCEGKQLLVGTTEGEVSVFGQKDFLLNDWTCLYSATFPGEHIVGGIFFHNGRRLVMVDKKLDAPITERIQALRSTPTLKGFGGVPIPGVCVLSSTGLVGVVTGDGSSAGSLHAHRDHVTAHAMAHKARSLLLAGVCVSMSGACVVRCALCNVSKPPSLTLTPLPTLLCSAQPSCISWVVRSEPDSLLVGGSTLTMWRLSERQVQPHKLLAKGNTAPTGGQKPADCFNTLVWQQTGAWQVQCSAMSSGRAHLPGAGTVAGTAGTAGVALAAHGTKLHLIHTDKPHVICTRQIVTSGPEQTVASPPKKTKYGNGQTSSGSCAVVSGVASTSLGGACVCVDTHAQIHLYKIHAPTDMPTALSVQHTSTVLEFALVSGWDYLDVLLTLKPNVVEGVYERVTESFQRQPASFQQYYFHSWLKMRIALCRLIPSASSSVSWLTCLSTLWGLWACVQASLRPLDKPEDKLLVSLLDEHNADHDKALLALESKTELPSEMFSVTALRRPLQRAVDIAVTALAAATTTHTHNGYELWADPVGVALLRRLVVCARGAGAGAGDLALGRLLARLHQPAKPDLIEECGAVAALYGARVWEALPRCAISAPHQLPPPYYCEYLTPPERLRVAPPPPAALLAHTDHAHPATTHMDSIRYTFLGGGRTGPVRWRGCARCGARALHVYTLPTHAPHSPAPAHAARHPLLRAHDARHITHCRCGGKWTLFSIL